jgi:outer membrane protein assembly factor BamB
MMDNRFRFKRAVVHVCLIVVGIVTCVVTAPAHAEFGDLMFRLPYTDPRSEFGESVSISGTTAIVGAPEGARPGSAYLFDVTTGQQIRRLAASDGAPGVNFASDVAILGNTALVGGNNSNKAYLFDVTTGQELFTFMGSDAVPGDLFGHGVALSGNKAIVIARGPSHFASAAYVFEVSSGQKLQKYTPSDSVPGDRFGVSGLQGSIAVSGNIGIGGDRSKDDGLIDSGAAYLFDVTTGKELFKLQASDPREDNLFGQDVAISDNKALVGATHSIIGSDTDGAAYLFDVTTGQQLFKFAAPNTSAAGFGWSVGLNSTTAIVGARNESAAYLFDLETGQMLKRLTVPTGIGCGSFGCQFGASVAINDNFAVIGARSEGAAYVFDISRGPALPGDFNNDGTVDAADYVVWRNGLGTTYTQTDYAAWRTNFGSSAVAAAAVTNTLGANGFANIPEPASVSLFFLGVLSVLILARPTFH